MIYYLTSTFSLSLVNLFRMKQIIIRISFSMCDDGRHVVTDEESTLSQRTRRVMCTFYRLCSPLRHRRWRSLVFVVIIADEYERERERERESVRRAARTEQTNTSKDRKRKQTRWKEYISQRSESTIISLSQHRVIDQEMRNSEHNSITKTRNEKKICIY